ncbi:helix-turn-helix transcriptional regulator [Caulobacter sp. S45]|jgi:DNA-binding CsgD family transcriptional regulator|uniref:helix-turn-helix transcriptional regulator n=1 Tax=Caulobacter sp. S45 TaxID=1641861 RepID=UPI00131DB3DD|nr:helix-turn-helix transcriptional regulator [Caulobacter sp. S45]
MPELTPATQFAYWSHNPAGMASVIDALGEDDFPDAFGRTLSSVVPAKLFSVFRLDDQQRMRYMFAGGHLDEDDNDEAFARSASARYADSYWKLDPALRSILDDGDWNTTVRTQAWDAIPPSEYRAFCYERVHVRERLLICRRFGAETIMVGLYRTSDEAPFEPDCFDRLQGAAEMLTSISWKHSKVMANTHSRNLLPGDGDVSRQLAATNGQLSSREVEVCTGLLLGRSTKEIARTVGVMPSSIVTFRKRAFLKLKIATRQDLVRLYERSLDA